ncbi:MAG: phosphodiester glycosidase family protein [Oscillospiraceae bacterium]|jgi:hypothetical protein|nr:phosphodiester glycosidase family protein [Oscillospiraceae bacterium]
MKRRIIAAAQAALLILSLAFSINTGALAATVDSPKYINTKQLAENLSYVNTVYWNDELGRQESYVLRASPGGQARPIVMKDETVYGRVDVASAEAYARAQGMSILAAVNADFFAMQTGVPLGIVIEDGRYISSAAGEAAAAFREDGSLFFVKDPGVKLVLTNSGGAGGGGADTGAVNTGVADADGFIRVDAPGAGNTASSSQNAGSSVTVTNLNKMRQDTGGAYLYTSDFSSVSTRAASPGWYVRFEIVGGELTVSGEMTLRVAEAARCDADVPIGEGHIVLTQAGEPNADFYKFAPGDVVSLKSVCEDDRLREARWAAGCGDFIVEGHKIADYSGWDNALIQRNPRTAIGVTDAGETVVCVIDGRSSTYSAGVTLFELADEMIALGCVTAVNLDGGGSSVMSVKTVGKAGAEVVNRPSDGAPRRCSTYIMFAYDVDQIEAPPDSDAVAAKRLSLENDGAIVLRGSSVELTYAASDKAYHPAAAPEDVAVTGAMRGSVDGNVYTATGEQGPDHMNFLSESTEAYGFGEIFVINEPTSVTARGADGEELLEMTVSPGSETQLAPAATYYRKAVVAQPQSFAYSVSGDIGEISPDGVFTAAGKSGVSGEIKISAGTHSAVVKVSVYGFEDTVGHWAREFIEELRVRGVVGGVTETEFAPGADIRRADFVVMLHRALGLPEPRDGEAANFSDVPEDAYYAAAVKWAKQAGAVNGVGEDIFDPTAPLTREQAFTLVYRTFEMFRITMPEDFTPELSGFGFEDAPDVSDYAVQGAAALAAAGIVGGSDGRLNPKNIVSRAEMAKLLCAALRLEGTQITPIIPEPPEPPDGTEIPSETPDEPTNPAETPDTEETPDAEETPPADTEAEPPEPAAEPDTPDAAGSEPED